MLDERKEKSFAEVNLVDLDEQLALRSGHICPFATAFHRLHFEVGLVISLVLGYYR